MWTAPPATIARKLRDSAMVTCKPERDPARILVGLLCPIGDTLFATPALAALRRRFPQAHITALVYRANTGILDGNPDLDERIVLHQKPHTPLPISLANSAPGIRRGSYDLLVSLSPAASVVGALAGTPERARLRMARPLWWLVGSRDAAYRQRHAVDHYLRAVAPLLDGPVPDEERCPRIYLSEQHRQKAERLLRGASASPGDRLVALHAGGDGFRGRKRWSTKRFAAVGRHLTEQYGARMLLVGGREDAALSAEVTAALPDSAIDLAGKTSLMETAALIERAALFIGNDSCPLHIAAAVGTPAVGIFGPSSVAQFAPVGGPRYASRAVHADLPCSPCFHFIGSEVPWLPNPCHSFACLKAIPADAVIQAAVELLG